MDYVSDKDQHPRASLWVQNMTQGDDADKTVECFIFDSHAAMKMCIHDLAIGKTKDSLDYIFSNAALHIIFYVVFMLYFCHHRHAP